MKQSLKRVLLASILTLVGAMPVAAQTPEDMVRWIYTSLASDGHVSQQGLDFMSSPDQRKNYFTERMVAFYVANDSYGGDLARACVDFGFAVPGQDYDATEIARSLRLTSQRGNDRITVTAEFTNFGAPARVIYDFVPEAGYWKIDDIAGQGFRVSQINCSPKASATQPATVSQTAYCFQKGDDVLRLDLARDGSARLEFLSWQANGHTCSGQQSGTQVADGWRFPGDLGCQLQVVVTADGGVELKDPEWVCKTTMCGQRAVVDGLTFPHSSRVDCANWRGMGN